MDSVRKGLRTGEIEMDTFERLECSECDVRLRTRDDPDEIGTIRYCPKCGQTWRAL